MIVIQNKSLKIGSDCSLNIVDECIEKDGFSIALSRIQFKIVYYLANNIGQTVKTQEIIRFTWKITDFDCFTKDELYVYIHRIRKLIEKDAKYPKFLKTKRGEGYILYPIE